MNTGGQGWSGGLARATDPGTSHVAAAAVPNDLEARVLEELRKFPNGATSFQLAESMALSLVTVSPRMRPLVDKGYIEDSGQRRRGESGRAQIVWRARG